MVVFVTIFVYELFVETFEICTWQELKNFTANRVFEISVLRHPEKYTPFLKPERAPLSLVFV